jgi:hypothetical protein
VVEIDTRPGEGSGLAEAEAGEGEQVKADLLPLGADRGVDLA